MGLLRDLNAVVYSECLARGKHSVPGSQDESALKLKTDSVT